MPQLITWGMLALILSHIATEPWQSGMWFIVAGTLFVTSAIISFEDRK